MSKILQFILIPFQNYKDTTSNMQHTAKDKQKLVSSCPRCIKLRIKLTHAGIMRICLNTARAANVDANMRICCKNNINSCEIYLFLTNVCIKNSIT